MKKELKINAGFWCFLLLAFVELLFLLGVVHHDCMEPGDGVSSVGLVMLKSCDGVLLVLFLAAAVLCCTTAISKVGIPILFAAVIEVVELVTTIIASDCLFNNLDSFDCIMEDCLCVSGDFGFIFLLLFLPLLCIKYNEDTMKLHPVWFCFFWAVLLIRVIYDMVVSDFSFFSTALLLLKSVIVAFLYFWIGHKTKVKPIVYVLLVIMVVLTLLAGLISTWIHGSDISLSSDPEKDWGAGLDWGDDHYWNTNSHSVEHKI